MGAHWLFDLDDWLREDEIPFREWPGWLTRSRSTGGFDEVWGIVDHHTGGVASWQNDCRYMWENAATRPIGNVHIDRAGIVTIGAAGATNTAGRGLADWHTSNGVIPVVPSSMGNRMTFNIEAANNGVGEQWPREQVHSYMRLNNLLARKLQLDLARDLTTHRGWAGARKSDPYGPAQGHAQLGTTYWSVSALRNLSRAAHLPPPTSPGDDDMALTADDIASIATATANAIYGKDIPNPLNPAVMTKVGYVWGSTYKLADATRKEAVLTSAEVARIASAAATAVNVKVSATAIAKALIVELGG